MDSTDYSKPFFDLDGEDEEEEMMAMVEKEEKSDSVVTGEQTESKEEDDSENKNMALTTRMSQTVVNVSQKVFSYFQKGSSVVFRWFWVGGIVFWVVGLPLIRTRDKQIQFDELLAKFAYKVKELNSSKKPRFKHI